MKKLKVISACLATAMLASSMVLPSSAASSSFTPSKTNFATLFDFDSTPTAKYTDGYHPGTRTDVIGDSKSAKCITADGIGYTYDLTIAGKGGYSGNALKLDVTDNAPAAGSFCPVSLYPCYGENKNPTVPSGYTATDFCFWVDFTGYKNTNCKAPNVPAKGIQMYFQEKDYDATGKEVKTPTAWWLKTKAEGGYWQIEDGNGGWKNMPVGDGHDCYIPNTYKGWIKLPLSNFELLSGGQWDQHDQDGKIDAKCVEQICLGMGNYAPEAGSTVLFDQFGFMMQSNTPETTNSSNTSTSSNNTNTTATGTVGTSSTGNNQTQTTSTPDANTTTSESGSATTATSTSDSTNVSNPKTGSVPTALGAVAVITAGIAFAARKKKK